ncbi:MAG TPA: hypothetical protein VIK59_00910 [Verrucomicrobiae bacterium]
MSVITLKAHYDGKQVCLDEPYEFPVNSKLIVTVLPGDSLEEERQAWLAASQAAFVRAYGDDEPDYSNAVLRETPPRQ